MTMNVVVVESPSKAKTINKYLGPGYKVLASFGHVRDLPAKDGSVRPDEDFEMSWEVDGASAKRMKDIADAVKSSDGLILATDPDREGEAISWHVLDLLKKKKVIGDKPVKRVAFNAITKKAVLEAIAHPRDIDISLVDAVYSSCCLPGIFEPFERGGYHYMDGGIVDPLPLRFAKALRPDLIIAVDLTVKATYKTPNYKQRVVSTLFRAFEIVEEVLVEQALHMHADHTVALIQPKVGHLHRFDFDQVQEVVDEGEAESLRVLTSHAATRDLVSCGVVDGLSCPVTPRDYVSLHIDPTACIGCGMCEMVCETDGYWAHGEKASVRKVANYECTRDSACARNCPTDAIRLGNL